jgi:hypothetical protein
LSFGLINLNTVERRKIKSGSSAANAGPGHSPQASRNKTRGSHFVSCGLAARDVMKFSVGGLPPM